MPTFSGRKLWLPIAISLALAGCSKPLSHDELLARASEAFAEGRLNAAEIDAKTALQQNTRSAEGRRLLGEVFLRQRSLAEAAVEFEKSLDAAPDPAVAVLYAEALLGAGEAQKLVDLNEDAGFAYVADDPAWLALVARAQAQSGDSFTAADTLSRALQLAPEHPQVRLSQAFVSARHAGEVADAEAILKALTESHPEFEEAWSLYGSFKQSRGDFAAAEQAFATVSALNPFRLNDRLGLVATLVEQGKHSEAGKELEKLEKVIPDHPGVNYAQARIMLEGGNVDGSLQELAKVLNVAPDHLPSIYLAANANFREGNLATAEAHLTRFLASQPNNINARQMLAAVHLQMGEPERAETLARRLLEELPMNVPTMNLLALALTAQGMHGASAEVYQQMAGVTPDSAPVQMELGTALVRAGDIGPGVAALEAARKLDPENPEISSRLVRAHAADGDPEAAQAELEALRASAPDSPLPGLLGAQLALEASDRAGAAEQFRQVLAVDPGNTNARQGLAALAMQDDDSAAALDILNEGLAAQPDDLQSMLNLAAVHERRGETEEMVKALEKAAAAHPGALEPRLMLGRYHFQQQRPGEAVRLLTEVREAHNGDPRLHQLLVGAFIAVDQPGAAVNAGRRLVELLPENARALRLAAQAERANGDLPAAESTLRKALELQSDDVDSRKMLVEVLLQQNKLAETSEQLAQLPEGVVAPAQLDLARGRLALTQGDFAAAEELLRKAHGAEPGSNSLLFLTTALWQQGKQEDAWRLLESWLEQNPEDQLILNQLGPLYLSQGRDSDAVRVFETLHRIAPDDVVTLNNLAWSLRQSDPQRALGLVREALVAAPDTPAIQDTQAMILLELGNHDEALAVSQRTLDVEPQNTQFRFHRARILAGAGDKAAAVTLLQQLVNGPAFPEQAQARELLAELRN
ncbi:MAG: PEP-CTERM system TPR-repeat protein PrsT [Haliea sp.]|uniref:XrtA/PEP-CTERM system TPR-repeat protein PrsT n=1 Tax=Haliea sp. TaxID=1932666 RepID=UPI0032F0497A